MCGVCVGGYMLACVCGGVHACMCVVCVRGVHACMCVVCVRGVHACMCVVCVGGGTCLHVCGMCGGYIITQVLLATQPSWTDMLACVWCVCVCVCVCVGGGGYMLAVCVGGTCLQCVWGVHACMRAFLHTTTSE